MEDNDNLIWTTHDYLDLQTKKIPSALVNIFVALYFVQYAVTLTKYFVQLAVALLQTILRLAVALTMRATRRRRQTDNFVQLAHALTHLTSRRRADKTSYNTPSGWIIVHWMKLCHSVKWNVTERLLKCDGLAYLYNSVEWMAQLYPVIRYITKRMSMMLELYCFGFWIHFSINKINNIFRQCTQLFSVSYYVKFRKLKFPQGWAGDPGLPHNRSACNSGQYTNWFIGKSMQWCMEDSYGYPYQLLY